MHHDQQVIIRLLMDDRFRDWVKLPTLERNRYWEQRLQDHPEERAAVEQARLVLQHLDFKKSQQIDRAGILERALAQAQATSSHLPQEAPHSAAPVRSSRPWYWAAAASLVGLALVLGYWLLTPSMQTYTTAYGESKRMLLPDSSVAVLNANSTLSYPLDWEAKGPRRVTLSGEAFFSVTHQQDHRKFIVQANELTIEVLGTEFNVNHRRGETEVVLQTGSIRLDWSVSEDSAQEANMVIAPGEMVVYSQEQKDVRREVVNPTLYSSWTQKRLLFDKTPLAEVFAMIKDNYGYEVQAAPDIAKKVFTAEIDHADLDLLLDFLSESFNLAITKNQQTIIVKQK